MIPTSPTGAIAWLAIAALVIRLLIQAINSNHFDLLLSQLLGRPVTIPDKWLPDLALALGFLGGVLTALSTGASWQSALEQAFAGVMAGLAANLHLGQIAAAKSGGAS